MLGEISNEYIEIIYHVFFDLDKKNSRWIWKQQ